MPVTEAGHGTYAAGVAEGRGAKLFTATLEILEERAGITVPQTPR